MTIAYRSHSIVSDSGSANYVVSKPAGTVDGDLLVATAVCPAGLSISSAPVGWTALPEDSTGAVNTHVRQRVYYKVASSEPASWTWTFSAASLNHVAVVAYSTDRGFPADPLDVTAVDTDSTSDPNLSSPQVTTTGPDRLLVHAIGARYNSTGGATITADGATTERFDAGVGGGSHTVASIADETKATAGTSTVRNATSNRNIVNVWRTAAFYDSGEPPTASYSWVADGLSVDFTDTSTDPDDAVDAWAWDFGDGGSATTANPTHVFAAAGAYTVTLTVTDESGNTDDQAHVVVVAGEGSLPDLILASSPVLYWPLDDSGSTARDASGSGRTGSIVASPALQAEGPEACNGAGSYAAQFAGDATGPSDAEHVYRATSPVSGTSDYSLELWFRPDADAFTRSNRDLMVLWQQRNAADDTQQARLFWNGSVDFFGVRFGLPEEEIHVEIPDEDVKARAGCWSHVVLTKSGTTYRFYFNGVERDTVTTSRGLRGTDLVLAADYTQIAAGGGAWSSSEINQAELFKGRLAHFAVYAGVLSADDVAARWAAGCTTCGRVKVWDGTSWVTGVVKVWDGSAWVEKPVKVWTGSAWV